MPNMDGLEMLKLIRGDAALTALPVLMVMAESKKESVVAAAQAGVNGYGAEPFAAGTLDETLKQILENLTKVGA